MRRIQSHLSFALPNKSEPSVSPIGHQLWSLQLLLSSMFSNVVKRDSFRMRGIKDLLNLKDKAFERKTSIVLTLI